MLCKPYDQAPFEVRIQEQRSMRCNLFSHGALTQGGNFFPITGLHRRIACKAQQTPRCYHLYALKSEPSPLVAPSTTKLGRCVTQSLTRPRAMQNLSEKKNTSRSILRTYYSSTLLRFLKALRGDLNRIGGTMFPQALVASDRIQTALEVPPSDRCS